MTAAVETDQKKKTWPIVHNRILKNDFKLSTGGFGWYCHPETSTSEKHVGLSAEMLPRRQN